MTLRHERAMAEFSPRHGARGVCAMMGRHEWKNHSWRTHSLRHDAPGATARNVNNTDPTENPMPTERDNSGTVSRNNKKTEDKHPDIRGQCTIDGRAYWIAGWRKENKRGAFYSLAFTPKDPTPDAPATPDAPDAQAKSMREVASLRVYTAADAADALQVKPLPSFPTGRLRDTLDDDIPF